ncbi:uncharacterized protein MONBRDRAFT_30361 [Monosiga brevicollis MX1]|uniref:Uncharacterized protein n=1 Tax=Monosiga brevicollis TaxID=81824 RepID=A9VDR8_MONBE|nr:uncharacterized protein MONBRDRAFT_30361 [Monosiga brevicollis MX1]EDQ84308.1 predicted protein [Monosiga brevicollis MX1]|eukprot:XP_001750878.1 hypothetical protein [Monosiga brevicollis MX1]
MGKNKNRKNRKNTGDGGGGGGDGRGDDSSTAAKPTTGVEEPVGQASNDHEPEAPVTTAPPASSSDLSKPAAEKAESEPEPKKQVPAKQAEEAVAQPDAPSQAIDEKEAPEPEATDIQALIQEIATQYASYARLDVDVVRKELSNVDTATEVLLARIDETQGVVDSLTQERQELTDKVLPALQANCEKLVGLFMVIEQLDALVQGLRANVDEVESQLTALDGNKTLMSSMLGRMKLTSFFSRGNATQAPANADASNASANAASPIS